MRSFSLPILALLLAVLWLSGCSVGDALGRKVDHAEAERALAQAQQVVADAKGYLADMANRLITAQEFIAAQDIKLAQARAFAEQSESAAARAVVTALEQAKHAAEASIPLIQAGITQVQQRLPQLEALAGEAKAKVQALGEGASPLWYILGTLLLPVAIKGAQVASAGIPGVGPAVAMVAETAITGLWNTLATARLKAKDAETEARAAALPFQIAVTSDLLQVAPADKRQAILDVAKADQKAAGVHATLEPLIAAAEVKAA